MVNEGILHRKNVKIRDFLHVCDGCERRFAKITGEYGCRVKARHRIHGHVDTKDIHADIECWIPVKREVAQMTI